MSDKEIVLETMKKAGEPINAEQMGFIILRPKGIPKATV